MSRSAPVVPGFVTVSGAGKVLHLAPRSVRDLIYSGRLPSVRLGRLHFVNTADLEIERRRRLGLPLPRPRVARPRVLRRSRSPGDAGRRRVAGDPATRARRAAERAAALQRWLGGSGARPGPRLPFQPRTAPSGARCQVCGRVLGPGERVFEATEPATAERHVCLVCGRRALLAWADERTHEAAAARRLAREPSPGAETARGPSPGTETAEAGAATPVAEAQRPVG